MEKKNYLLIAISVIIGMAGAYSMNGKAKTGCSGPIYTPGGIFTGCYHTCPNNCGTPTGQGYYYVYNGVSYVIPQGYQGKWDR